ncbi:hypothetical protein [Flavobacterium lindanitolerans]|jgi:hypothetical protein|uniref:hypothetical protein n=1 Tax=Flavobacterium lindanitolerans TaxID=428988 RepID=UPI002806CBEE|nr:hypothetical protein [Flavobacterium lindanitolerans]MDQ7961897.1 hypothetical protein [Flavobacterium lindanitolerans]
MRALKIISDLLPIPSYTVILICFFFPFITIKCGTTELVSVTGFDYVVGTDIKEKTKNNEFSRRMENQLGKNLFGAAETDLDSLDVDEDGDPIKEESLFPEETAEEKSSRIVMMVMMGIPFFMAIAGLIFSFVKIRRKGLLHIVISSIGFLVLLFFGMIIKSSDELNAVTSMAEGMGGGMISIGMGTAYYLATILFLLMIMFFGMLKYLKNLYKEEQAIREEALDEFLTKE